MYDIHCHILPAIDDGAQLLEESLQMAEGALREKTHGIVCTPHVMSEHPYDIRSIVSRLRRLRKALSDCGIPIRIFSGQEIMTGANYRDIPRMVFSGELLTLNGSGYILIEFEPSEEFELIAEKAAYIASRGFVPVIAHPERYKMSSERGSLTDLKKLGALLQVNKGSLSGSFGHSAADTAHYLLSHRLADFVASDAHSPYVRTPYMMEAYEAVSELYSADYAELLFTANPMHVLKNEKITQNN